MRARAGGNGDGGVNPIRAQIVAYRDRQLAGYLVYRLDETDGLRYGHIVDLLAAQTLALLGLAQTPTSVLAAPVTSIFSTSLGLRLRD